MENDAAVRYPPLAVHALDDYLDARGRAEAGALFVAKPDAQLSPHSLRHAHATIALDTGAPLHVVQDDLGHTDPRTTRRYDRARHTLTRTTNYLLDQTLTGDLRAAEQDNKTASPAKSTD